MNFQKINKFYILILLLIGCKTPKRDEVKIVKGYFLYEINIPNIFHTEGDAIVQDNLFIRINKKKINKETIEKAYLNGVYDLFDNFSPYTDDENSKSLGILIDESNNLVNDYHRNINKKKYFKIGKLVFVMFKGTLIIEKKIKKKWLIPKKGHYNSAFENEEKEIDTYIVKKVVSFEFVEDGNVGNVPN